VGLQFPVLKFGKLLGKGLKPDRGIKSPRKFAVLAQQLVIPPYIRRLHITGNESPLPQLVRYGQLNVSPKVLAGCIGYNFIYALFFSLFVNPVR